jgi:Fe-S-cluster containining protein
MIDIDNIIVRDEVLNLKFTCDLNKCKGACCTLESEFGAPLRQDEIEQIEKYLPIIFEKLPENHVKAIKENGFWEKKQGELLTKSIDNKACVFVYYDNGIAKCGIEKSFFEGKIDFQKPISCHLFPIRVTELGGDILRYEKFSECVPALEEGQKTNLTIAEFCKDSLIRRYGKTWYSKLKKFIGR